MPLKEGSDRKTIDSNISKLVKAGYSQDEIIAIAMDMTRKSKKRGTLGEK